MTGSCGDIINTTAGDWVASCVAHSYQGEPQSFYSAALTDLHAHHRAQDD